MDPDAVPVLETPVSDVPPSTRFTTPPLMTENLAAVSRMSNYCRWIFDMVSPHLGTDLLEAGCGNGNLTRWLLSSPAVQRLVGVDHAPALCDQLRERLKTSPKNWTVLNFDLQDERLLELSNEPFDAIVCLNVLEHIDRDVELLERFHRLLKPGGRLILLVPAFPWLYGSIDREVHHLRRYRRKDLVKKIIAADLSVHQMRYFNLGGIPAWIWHGKILQLKIHREGDMRFWDRLVPCLQRFEKTIPVPAGLSLFAVAVKPAES